MGAACALLSVPLPAVNLAAAAVRALAQRATAVTAATGARLHAAPDPQAATACITAMMQLVDRLKDDVRGGWYTKVRMIAVLRVLPRCAVHALLSATAAL